VFSRILIRIGMYNRGVIVFLCILLLCGCFIMGCSSLPFSGTPPQEIPRHTVGLSSGNISVYSPDYTNFADALSDLALTEHAGTGNATPDGITENGILYIRGDAVDPTGNASSWLFVVREGNKTSFVTYTPRGKSAAGWSAGFNGTIIPEERMFPIKDLFDQNHAAIFEGQASNLTGSWNIIMENGNYTLSSNGTGVSRTLIFNATNGVLISSYA